ncbi:threonine aldolase family protein [Ferruginibacter sp.]
MPKANRRNFLKLSGLSALPAMIPAAGLFAAEKKHTPEPADELPIKFFGDGEMFEPAAYIDLLKQANSTTAIERDRYGDGGSIAALEKKFTEITGKEKAIFMPTGTMANQLAIAVLSGENTKVFVQDTSHVYRDEADAAQSVFQKRLMPLAKGETYFTAAALKQAVDALAEQEVFKSGVGAVSIENPVRRSEGRMVPLDEIKKISAYCKANDIKLHLDGARIFLAAAWSGVSVKEYASYFDTVYISLYKYMGAAGGAVLCGDKKVIEKMPHLIKIHGGSMYGNWANAAMALNRLEGLELRMLQTRMRSTDLFTELNKLPGIKITALDGGTNLYKLELAKEVDGKKLQASLKNNFNIRMPIPDNNNSGLIAVNETLLYRDLAYVVDAFTKSLA